MTDFTDRRYIRRLIAATRRGAALRLGGRYSVLRLAFIPALAAAAALILRGMTVESAAVAIVAALVALAGWVALVAAWSALRAPSEMDAELRSAVARTIAERNAQYESLAKHVRSAEQQRRGVIIGQLRQLYVLSHDGLSSEMLAGIEPLPKLWVEAKLSQMGETWRQDEYK